MDSKALAKSKRAHSLHHAKKPQKPRVPPPSTQKPRLPSNWGRYDDGDNDDPTSHDDAVLPKSKGADFRHLVDEARSSHQRQVASLDDELLLSSQDDVFPAEFNERMIRVKGERIAAWIEDDDFVVDDGASASAYEASMFSLNLSALSEQLEKVDISERLFIEADLLATDMVTQEANCGKVGEYEKTKMPSFVEELNKVDHTTDIFLSGSSPGGSEGFKSVDQGLSMTSQVRDDSSSSQHCTSSQSKPSSFIVAAEEGSNMPALGLPTFGDRSDTSNRKSKSSYFEVSASEAELDTLLDSFNVSNIHGSSENNINRTSEVGSAANGYPKHVIADKGSDVGSQTIADLDFSDDSRAFQSKAMDFHAPGSTGCDILPKKYLSTFETAAAEEELDMLRNSASDSKSQGPRLESVSDILKELPKPVAKFPKEVSGSQVATVTGNLDDALDDILQETSKTMNQNSSYQPEMVKSAIGEHLPPSHTLSKSNPLDDFDSWMDSL